MKNDFATLLSRLVHESGIKMANISTATGYDLSYVSKWTSGKMLPSEKGIEMISGEIAKCICSSSDKELDHLLKLYGCTDSEDLYNTIYELLLQSYFQSKDITKKRSHELYERISIGEILRQLNEMYHTGSDETVCIVDLFNLDCASRLEFARIHNGRSTYSKDCGVSKLTIVVCLDAIEDVIYDCLYLLHLIAIFSNQKLTIYNSTAANGKILCIVGQRLAVSGVIFPKDNACTSVSIVGDSTVGRYLLQVCSQHIERTNMVFRTMSVEEFAMSRSYIKSMLTECNKWLIGHITELLLPNDLFEELLEYIHADNNAEYRSIYGLAQEIIQNGKVSIMIYETVLSDLLATGEIDFFNQKINLNCLQISRLIEYLIRINNANIGIKMIKTGFSPHFEHLYNPCLFISASETIMRLENAYERDSVLIYVDSKVKRLIGRFFDLAWSSRQDVVIEDVNKINEILVHYHQMNLLLPQTKQVDIT